MLVKTAAALALIGATAIAAVAPAFAQAGGHYRPDGTYVDGSRAAMRPPRPATSQQNSNANSDATANGFETQAPAFGQPMGNALGSGYTRTIGSPYGR